MADRHDGHGSPCEVCGGPSDTMVNCSGGDHPHILCERCDRFLTGEGWTWAGDAIRPRCPNDVTEADRVLLALTEEGPRG